MYELKIIRTFAAAHQLLKSRTKCENLHGHNWKIEVHVKGKNLDQSGMMIDFGILKKHVDEILESLDHQFLNELPFLKDISPSSENIARYIAETLNERIEIPDISVSRVCAWESDNACATYIPE
ncbi:6-pyruvoyl tetrahydrobiopterin synthase [Candidatus Magnetomorum sp. HK-1]|nr:6-pyruvoyl tetrahydrobiopterin synthase [Candidatus Magnetomorum sp. HK-1]